MDDQTTQEEISVEVEKLLQIMEQVLKENPMLRNEQRYTQYTIVSTKIVKPGNMTQENARKLCLLALSILLDTRRDMSPPTLVALAVTGFMDLYLRESILILNQENLATYRITAAGVIRRARAGTLEYTYLDALLKFSRALFQEIRWH